MTKSLKRVVLDVLKPHQPILPEFAEKISEIKSINGVNLSLLEIDKETETIKITIEGENIDYNELIKVIREFGGVVHSIDEVAAGKNLVEEAATHQGEETES